MTSPTIAFATQDDFSGGVNQFPEKALNSKGQTNQVLDALNVWAPNRALEKRPGYYYAGAGGQPVGPQTAIPPTSRAYQTVWGGTMHAGAVPAASSWQVAYFQTGARMTWAQFFPTLTWQWQYRNTAGRWLQAPGNGIGYLPADLSLTGDPTYGANLRVIAPAPTILNPVDMANQFFYAADGLPDTRALFAAQTLNGKWFVMASYDPTAGLILLTAPGLSLQNTSHGGAVAVIGGQIRPVRPPSIAVIPDFNVIYMALNNVVYDCSPGTTSFNTIAPAAINSDPDTVGPRVGSVTPPYSSDVLALDTAFPAAQLLCYFDGLLFAVVDDFVVKWSAPAVDGAYNVWPSLNFETIAGDDNSPITAIAPLNEQLVVYKRDSITVMVAKVPDVSDITQQAQFQPTRVVSGVGCIAPGSLQSIRGKHIFRARDGWYQFDGSPNIVKLTAPIDKLAHEIDYGQASTMTAADWKTKHSYVVAYSTATGRKMLAYDYDNQAWLPWTTNDAMMFLVSAERPDLVPTLYGCTDTGLIVEWGYARDDFGADISAYILTHRLGDKERRTKSAREIRIESTTDADALDVELLYEDQDGTTSSLALTSTLEPKWGSVLWNAFAWTGVRRRERKIACRGPVSRWHQVKLSTAASSDGRPWKILGLALGVARMGRR